MNEWHESVSLSSFFSSQVMMSWKPASFIVRHMGSDLVFIGEWFTGAFVCGVDLRNSYCLVIILLLFVLWACYF